MNKNVFNSIKQGLNEAAIIAKGKKFKTTIYKVSCLVPQSYGWGLL